MHATPTTSKLASAVPVADVVIRPLKKDDLEAVVALDRRITGTARKGYFVKRLEAALRRPKAHYQFAATTGEGLTGFLLGRVAGGEYGRPEAVGVLETVGVDPKAAHHGIGRKLLESFEGLLRSHQVHGLATQVDWRNHAMLKYLEQTGFEISNRVVLERKVSPTPLPLTDEEIEKWPPTVRHLEARDFSEVARIDKKITGRDRSEYLRAKFDEVLNESAVAVSLAVVDRDLLVGFAMARVDPGDYGRVDAVAALDTIGINPDFEKQGHGRALLDQLTDNLAALNVSSLETEVGRERFRLLSFLYAAGFNTSQRLGFIKRF